jgi:tetratricopeptide (TPR) repeat protein
LVAASAPEGRAWLEENLAVLTALVRLAEEEGFSTQCWQLARASWRPNFDGGHLDELVETHTIGLRVAKQLGDEVAVAAMLNYLSSAYYRLARFPEAIRSMEVALDLRGRLGLRGEVFSTLWNLGASYSANGDYRQGKAKFDEALTLITGMNDVPELTNLQNNLCLALLGWGRYDEALHRSWLALACQTADFGRPPTPSGTSADPALDG